MSKLVKPNVTTYSTVCTVSCTLVNKGSSPLILVVVTALSMNLPLQTRCAVHMHEGFGLVTCKYEEATLLHHFKVKAHKLKHIA